MYKKILLPYDFGNTFDNIPEQLAKMTENSEDSMITIFNVISDSEMSSDVKFNGKHFSSIAKDQLEKLKPFMNQLDELGLRYDVKFEGGRVITELLKEIKENDYDIVVMSNKRAKRDIQHVLGDVTHKIAKRVNTPVMIVK